jgi:hypothetical protein
MQFPFIFGKAKAVRSQRGVRQPTHFREPYSPFANGAARVKRIRKMARLPHAGRGPAGA